MMLFKMKPHHVFYINMDHRIARRKSTESQLGNVPYTRIPGVSVNIKDVSRYDIFDYLKERKDNALVGTVGCYLAHKQALEAIVKLNTEEACIILEDDIVFLSDDVWKQILDVTKGLNKSHHCDLVLIDTIGDSKESDLITDNIYKPSEIWPVYWGAHCYVVFGSLCAQNILSKLDKYPISDIDTCYISYCDAFVAKIGVCRQYGDSSDKI